ncbi:MAG: sigma-70 family RNA polymerase sigma factor [Verrucomicrobiales bacterium]|nr:sigma-70 family RNA polymerase sigma factor [Verrucomicrobiales bacterium]
MTATASSLQTRPSLLARLHDPDDAVGWDEFHQLYRKLVFGIATRSGLSREEAEEVVQDVMMEVSRRIGEFDYDPERGRFRGWLMKLTRWRVADKFRRRSRLPVAAPLGPGNDDATPLAERVPVADKEIEEAEAREWQDHLVAAAMARLAKKVPAEHFQAFQLYKLQGWSVVAVARNLGLNPGHVYLISHRLTRLLKQEVDRLRERLG